MIKTALLLVRQFFYYKIVIEEKYYKNDCLKIIMDIYKVIGSIRKLLVIIQMTKE